MTISGRELRSAIGADGRLVLSLEEVPLPDPGDDEVIVRVEATPINPSDLVLLLGPAEVSTLRAGGTRERPTLTFDIPPARQAAAQGRIGQSLAVGGEGAGTVVAAGVGARNMMGKRVAMRGGGMFVDYRKLPASEVVMLPDGVSAADGAAMFVNPLTALAFVATARDEGHSGIIHTAAASNLGQMLQKLCLVEGIPLVNIVRSGEQATILRAIGATSIVNSRAVDFREQLTDVVTENGATIAFDAIGGGSRSTTSPRWPRGS